MLTVSALSLDILRTIMDGFEGALAAFLLKERMIMLLYLIKHIKINTNRRQQIPVIFWDVMRYSIFFWKWNWGFILLIYWIEYSTNQQFVTWKPRKTKDADTSIETVKLHLHQKFPSICVAISARKPAWGIFPSVKLSVEYLYYRINSFLKKGPFMESWN